MSAISHSRPKTLGLFEQRFAGDESLIRLARLRFQQAHMGVEVHASTPQQLGWLASARPWGDAPMVVHLPRDFDLLQEATRRRIVELASWCMPSQIGLVVHDQQAMADRPQQYLDAVHQVGRELERTHWGTLFIEYAVGLDPGVFLEFFSQIRQLNRVTACVDIGHVGIRAAQTEFSKCHPGRDVCALKAQPPDLPSLMPDIDQAVHSAAALVLELIDGLGALNKPIHFHLHDGHPLSTFSPFGVSDHLSFFAEIPLKFEYRGRRSVPTMYGPSGLEAVVRHALQSIESSKLSFTLEIHPTGESLALKDAASLFEHWTIKTNAERTNHWLGILSRNHDLLIKTIDSLAR